MAQPVFLKNFTLDGFDMGELFVTANVTIPFLNVERGYYTVGNSDGQNLQNTRLNATQITIDGFLIRDFSDLTISETKDQLVAQVMSRRTQRLVFDALPDRYFNVVFEGSQDYDATDDALTPLTLTFTCPDGVAHSIEPDVFRNTTSTSANLIVDSEFETKTYWNEDTYVSDVKRNNSNVLGLDYSGKTIEEMDSTVNNMVADQVYYEDDTLAVGDSYTASFDYALLKKSDTDEDGTNSFELVVDEMDKQNGKVLSTKSYPLGGASGTGGQVMTAYAYNSTGSDRFSFEDNATPNMYPYTTSEAPIPRTYMGSVVTIDGNQSVPEWGATNARRVKITGGNNTIKGTFSTGMLTVGGTTYTHSIYVKNNGTKTVGINSNISGTYTLQPNESKRLTFTGGRPIGATASALQFIIQVANVADDVDITIWRAKISANTEADVWTEANEGTTDNTTPGFVGYSVTDNDSPSNLLLNGKLNDALSYWSGDATVNRSVNGEYAILNKTTSVSGNPVALVAGTQYQLYGSVLPSREYTVSAEMYVDGTGLSGATFTRTELLVNYADNTSQTIMATANINTLNTWQTVSATGTLSNKTISSIRVRVIINGSLIGNIRVRNIKLEEGPVATPFTRHVTERGQSYTWYTYGTGLNLESVPLNRVGYTFQIENAETKVLRLSWNAIGNTHVILNRPALRKGVSGAYFASAKEYLQAMPFTNYGTWKSYPTFKINNMSDNGLIGIINENGQVLQFGNEENVDATEPISDVYGLNETYRASTRPSNSVINAGHVSNYPYAGNNPETPNLYRGSYDFAPTEVTKPIMPNIGDTNSWVGPSLTTTIAAPPSGLRTGAYRYQEVIVFDTDADKRGRMELVVISEANDIVMGLTIRDSDATGNEIILEHWFGNKLLKTVKTDVSKFKNSTFRVTMERDSTGKKFNWNFENVQYVKNEPYKVVTKNPFNYNATIANKAPVAKVSRWLMKWREGRSTREVIDKQTWSFRTNNALNIRNSSTTNSKILGTMAKGVTFDSTKMQRGQTVVKDNRWFYVSKNTSKGIPASGWVSAYHLTQNKYVETKRKETFDSFTKMEIAGSQFLWVGTGKAKEAKNPFKAGDNVVLNTYDKTIFVNGVEREDLATIGNMWEGFAFEPGEHYLRFVNSDWSSNTLEVSVINNRTYL